MQTGCLVCVIYDSNSFIPSYSNLICNDCSHIEHVYTLYFVHILIIFLGMLNLDVIKSAPHLECLHCLIMCNLLFKQISFFIFKHCILIFHILKMYTGDAGPEQILVLFPLPFVCRLET